MFIFSGLAKCVDPIGTSIKVNEYLQYFGFGILTDLSLGMAWILCIAEFVCGMNILLAEGKSNRVVGYRNGDWVDFDIAEALKMQKHLPDYMLRVAKALSI